MASPAVPLRVGRPVCRKQPRVIRSSKPSPLMSPAEATDRPQVYDIGTEDPETLGRRQGRNIDIGKARGLAEHHDGFTEIGLRCWSPRMPTKTDDQSAKPSPLISPAEAPRSPPDRAEWAPKMRKPSPAARWPPRRRRQSPRLCRTPRSPRRIRHTGWMSHCHQPPPPRITSSKPSPLIPPPRRPGSQPDGRRHRRRRCGSRAPADKVATSTSTKPVALPNTTMASPNHIPCWPPRRRLSPDDQVIEPIAIDVPRRGDRKTAGRSTSAPEMRKPSAAVKVETSTSARPVALAEHHESFHQ